MVINLELPVIETKQETHDVKSIKLGLKEKIGYKPGQYFIVELDISEPENTRPLSIASSPTEDFLLFSTKISQSAFKQKFNSLNVGEVVKLQGPMGVFVLKEDAKDIMFLGGGIGITPFRDMIKYAGDKKLPIKLTLLYSNKTPADIVYKEEWPIFEKENSNLKVVHTVTDYKGSDWNGKTGRINEAMIREFCNNVDNTIFYICGPPAMVDGLSNLLKAMNVALQNIRVEKFAGY